MAAAGKYQEKLRRRYEPYSAVLDPALVEGWLATLQGGPNTQQTYLSGAVAYLDFLQSQRLTYKTAKRFAVEHYAKRLQKEMSPATASLYLSALRSLSRYLDQAHGIADMTTKITSGDVPRSHKTAPLPLDLAEQLLSSINTETLCGKRDFAVINLMLRSGLRSAEIARANVGDLITGEQGASLAIQGQGRKSKDQVVYLDPTTAQACLDYLQERAGLNAQGNPAPLPKDAPLIASQSDRNAGQALTPTSVSRIAKTRLEAIGADTAVYTALSLRHAAVAYSLLGGASPAEAQALARHAHASSTRAFVSEVQLMQAAHMKAEAYARQAGKPAQPQ